MAISADDFTTKILVPLAASFAGAFTAQNISERNRRRDDVLKELRSTNAAISLAYAICNGAMGLKRQHVRIVRQTYDDSRSAFIEFHRQRRAREIPHDRPFEFQADLRTLQVPKLDAATLRAHVLERINVAGRPLHLCIALDESATALRDMMEARNERVAEMQAAGGQEADDFIARYFGLPTGNGTIDERYPNLVHNVADSTDDVIYFAHLLCSDLEEHGKRVLKRYPRRFFIFPSPNLPRISSVNFATQKASGLIPPPDKYVDYLKAFVTLPDRPTLWAYIRHPIASWRVRK